MVYKCDANDVRHYFFGIIIKKIAMPEYEYRYLEKETKILFDFSLF